MSARLTIEYDGTNFAGWAAQPGQRTVQAELERALQTVLRHPVALTVAGRTDAGVHASAQVASHAGEAAPLGSLNALLPADVAVIASEPAAEGFDARRDCTSRAYRYRVLARPARPALDRARTLHWRYPIDRAALEACAALLVGTHDFRAFTPADTYHVRFERDVYAARWLVTEHDVLEFWIEADTFMRHMNRVLVGTMLEVARGRRSLEQFGRLLDGAPRAQAGPTAPACGLCFAGAGYGGRRLLSRPG
ncbi:tRNA pseudouridine(38-40) synthase TruA [Conexibacter sp. S30A1]|uniref:tRNA pseudouridine(38-40) synthase TruA n=1 Tax=Conexibacter sp. S30A1 TaxID=2937800 RepID=UPI00200FF3B5|nr:tRNA pseudouridine(38-40) synthase TruA [Conexibacter sp. S30A1]